MDQEKIGKFIAESRRGQGLTQMQLAELLNITDRAVSKWERGKSLPDSSIMLPLCDILKISVNDLLNGEVVSMEGYDKKLEDSLIELVRQKEESDRYLLILELVIGILSTLILIVPIFIAAYIPMEDWQRVVLCLSGFIPAVVGFLFSVRIEQIAGYYECGHCKHSYVPTYRAVNLAMHLGRTRWLKCPKCGKHSWQKKVLGKSE